MPTPAKDRFMRHVQESVDAIAYKCLMLTQDVPKFKNGYLTHSLSIVTGMVDKIRVYMVVNESLLKKSLPKGVLKHGDERKKKGKHVKAARR